VAINRIFASAVSGIVDGVVRELRELQVVTALLFAPN
jgi:hypothetical protein